MTTRPKLWISVHGGESSVPQDHFAYVAGVIVEAERPAYGKIECIAMADNCVLWLESLGVYQVPLPPLAATSLWDLIKEHLDTAAVQLRTMLAHMGQR